MNLPPRSTFVTVLAWIFIVLSGFATLIALMQNLMIAFVFPMAEFHASLEKARNGAGGQGFPFTLFELFPFLFLGFLAFSASALAASIGLLERRNWARILFIAVLAIAILWQFVGLGVMFWVFSNFPPIPVSSKHPEMAGQFVVIRNVMAGINLVMALAFGALFAWIIRRLVSPDIRREFDAGAA